MHCINEAANENETTLQLQQRLFRLVDQQVDDVSFHYFSFHDQERELVNETLQSLVQLLLQRVHCLWNGMTVFL